MKAWVLAVVSSAPQADDLAFHEADAHRLCAEKGWEVERVFSDVASGNRGVRALLTQLIAELRLTPKALRPQWIVMARLDRVGRGSIIDGQVALRDILQLGTRVWTLDHGERRLDSADEEMLTAIELSLARRDNDIRRQKSLAFHARKRAAGEFSGTPPFGFITIDKRLVTYEPEAQVMRDVFERRAEGWGVNRLALYAAQRAPAKRLTDGTTRPLKWSPSTLTRMLRNEQYREIVGEATWLAAATMWKAGIDRGAPRWPWPLRGALRCTCGLLLTVVCSGKDPHRTRYYSCRQLARHGSYTFHNAERMEGQFVELLRALADKDTPQLNASHRRPARRDVEQLRSERSLLVRERSAIEARKAKAWELAEAGSVPAAELATRLETLSAEIERYRARISVLDLSIANAEKGVGMESDIAQALRQAAGVWPSLPVESQREIARAVSAYVGGLWADPKRKNVMIVPGPEGDDVSANFFENMRTETSAWDLAALVRAVRAVGSTRLD
jgi:DNA invertase Pin-like site-specific DNA recombinase